MQNSQGEPNEGSVIKNVYVFDEVMEKNNLILIYEGVFTQEITKSVLSMAERNFESEGVELVVKKKVFNVMVESLQNISKHQDSAKDEDGDSSSVFMIGYENEVYSIISGNVILNQNVPSLRSRIDQINSLDKDGLKQLYKEVRAQGTLSEIGGAGLGFIDMARKSGNKLDYSFEPFNNEISFFTLVAKVSGKKEEEEQENCKEI